MKRNEHTFQFTGNQIQEAATNEAAYHHTRIEFWKKEQDAAIKSAKEKGLELKEYPITGGNRVEMVVDPSLQIRISEAASKIFQHQQAYDRLRMEAQAYSTQGSRVYELQADDVLYFRLVACARLPEGAP